jgi:hypothetical protein
MDVNLLLRDLAQLSIDEQTDIMYDEYVDALCANEEMMRYAAYSYDNDAIYYGMQ